MTFSSSRKPSSFLIIVLSIVGVCILALCATVGISSIANSNPTPTSLVQMYISTFIASTSSAAQTQTEISAPILSASSIIPSVTFASTWTPLPMSSPSIIPTFTPVPNNPLFIIPTIAQIPRSACCKICSKGQPCGNSCISRKDVCHKAPGCACP